jgi:hypothetical protein
MLLRQSAWRLALAAAVACGALLLAGCSCAKARTDNALIGTFKMGERVQAGKIIYNVLEAEWKAALTEGGRAPQHRFLFLRVSITNSGGQPVSVPAFELLGTNDTNYQEVTENMAGVRNWLGLLRTVAPATTEEGTVVFDAPLAAYKLVLRDGSEVDNERYAHVEVPVALE